MVYLGRMYFSMYSQCRCRNRYKDMHGIGIRRKILNSGCRFLETPIWMDPPGGGTPPDVDFWTTPGISIFGQPPKVWGVRPPFLKNPGFWSFSKKGGLTPQFLGVTEFCKFYQIFEGGSKKLSKKGQICHLYVFFTPPENDVFS